MEQDEPDVVELQDSDEGDVVRRVFIGEGGDPKRGWGGVGGLQVTQKGGAENFRGIQALLGRLQANWGASRCTKKGVEVFRRRFKALLGVSRHY